MPKHYDILLADDRKADVELMRLALLEVRINHSLHVVNDGDEALLFLRREEPYTNAVRPDLILLDIHMPRMSGHQVLDQIKADEELKAIPVVMLTTSDDPAQVLESYKRYANSHFRKPMDFNDLVSRVARPIGNYWFNVVELPPR